MRKKFDAEIGKVLKLVIGSIYTNKDIFLRELVSNSSDAMDKLKYLSNADQKLLENNHEFKIEININKDQKLLKIRDYGIGMDEADLVSSLGTIASSGTQKFTEILKQDGKLSTLIGQFGVGFYSSFMVSDLVIVRSKKAGSKKIFEWSSNGVEDYTISSVEDANFKTGTEVCLRFKEDDASYLDKFEIERIIKLYSNHISYPIILNDEEDPSESQNKIINSTKAIWLKPKSEITPEEYKEFYRQNSHMADDPFLIIHNTVEGSIEYSNLLFIPSKRPFDLYSPERKTSVKLYANKVFITDNNTHILPEFLRFVKGVVDSPDLPLNISRETFQNNDKISKIRSSLVKKIFSELRKKMEADIKSYQAFWETFGNVLKEGLCDYSSDKEQIMETCLFRTTKSGSEYITLDKYIQNMKDDQKNIYYITGEEYSDLLMNPQLEAFKKNDIEVLLLTDTVDDFWVNIVIDHKGKDIKSISSKDITVDEEKTQPQNNDLPVFAVFKEVLSDLVKDVKSTDKLVDSPACLSTEHGAMTIRMEKYLFEQKQLPKLSAKVLEINTEHHAIKAIYEQYKSQNNVVSNDLKDKVLTIFDLACLTAGDFVSKPNEFALRLSRMLFSKE